MQKSLRLALLSGLLSGLVPLAAGAKDCVKVRTSAPYRNLGYDHIVHITNHCKEEVTCRVATNVNPETITVQVPSKKTVDVVTFRGSPARTFRANVDCR